MHPLLALLGRSMAGAAIKKESGKILPALLKRNRPQQDDPSGDAPRDDRPGFFKSILQAVLGGGKSSEPPRPSSGQQPQRPTSGTGKPDWREAFYQTILRPIQEHPDPDFTFAQQQPGGGFAGASKPAKTMGEFVGLLMGSGRGGQQPPDKPPAAPASPSPTGDDGGGENPQQPERGRFSKALDKLNVALDVAGVVDPTGIADLANAGISTARSVAEPERRKEHLKNAGISAVSALPFGDVAKVAKSKKYAGLLGIGKAAQKTAQTERTRRAAEGATAQQRTLETHPNRSVESGSKPAIPPGRLISMMGNSPQEIQAAQEDEARRREESLAEDQANEERRKLLQSLKSLVKGAGAAAAALIAIPKATDRFSEALIESRRPLVRFHGGIAAAFARLERQNLQLGIRGAAENAGSTISLAEAVEDFRNEFQPVKEDLRTIANTIGKFGVKVGTLVTRLSNALAVVTKIRAILEAIEGNTSPDPTKDPNRGQVGEQIINALNVGGFAKGQGPRRPLPPLP